MDYLDVEQLAGILEKSFQVGIERIVTIAVSADNLEQVMALTRESSAIWGTQGIHPHEANHYNTDIEQIIRANAQNPRILAIGEIGLDYYYDHVDRSTQRSTFERQLELAAELNLPVVIHSRDADKDTQDILQNYSGRLPRKGVIHSFTSSKALAEYCLSEGFFLGFNGITTFNKADNVREVVSITPWNNWSWKPMHLISHRYLIEANPTHPITSPSSQRKSPRSRIFQWRIVAARV